MEHQVRAALAIGLSALLVGCRGEPEPVVAGDGELVLEVGGDHPSLRAALLARGLPVAPARVLVPVAASPEVPPTQPSVEQAGTPVDSLVPVADPPRPPQGIAPAEPAEPAAPEPEWTVVELPAGETLIHVARRHLGDGRRYLEVMQWNGWSEADARRLATGERIRLRTSQLVLGR